MQSFLPISYTQREEIQALRCAPQHPAKFQSRHLSELMAMQDSLGSLTFVEAFEVWIASHTPYIAASTAHYYRQYGAALCEFLGTTVVREIDHSHVRAYQLWRSRDQGEPRPDSHEHSAGPVRIRNEINGVLKPILKEAGIWEEVKRRKFRHLPTPRDGSGTFIPPEVQEELIDLALRAPRLHLAGRILQLMSRTGAGPGEILKLRRRDYDEDQQRIHIVVGAKNTGARVRWLYLTPSAIESMKWAVSRWDRIGGTDRNDFLFPHRSTIAKGGPFLRAMSGIHRAWACVRGAWLATHPGRKADMASIRLYDFRVSVAIVLLRQGSLSLATIRKILGWSPSSKMLDRYFKETGEALREAMLTLEKKPTKPASDGRGDVENAS